MDAVNRYFIEVITKNYVNFKGRARRKEFWMFWLFSSIVSIFLTIVDNMVFGGFPVLSGIFSLAVLLPSLSLSVRRLHDIGKDWPWLFIALVPIIGAIWLFVLQVTEGNKGDNEFGKDPKADVSAEA